ncbi:MAG: RnfABCDGE type electron transport complex subunit B [Lachnospiraceae bacterium]|nr:RnfABCDGE type electron transport complex subunit B [Lachnospiraceae bacterium]
MTGIIIATVMVGAVGLFVGLFLGVASIKFKVDVDEKEVAVLGCLPGNNCGGCGFPGCSGLAAAIAKGEAPVNQCPVGGEEVGKQIAAIMGVEAGESVRQVAFVHCAGDCEKATESYDYSGISDCQMKAFVPAGGPKACNFGCIGDGSCVKACPFDAIHIENGIAVVDKEACKACGKCIAICPKHLISLVPYDAKHIVQCMSNAKGAEVMKVCKAGCIGCGICAKNCPSEAITVENNLATIDQTKCTGCGICAEKCPKKIIM